MVYQGSGETKSVYWAPRSGVNGIPSWFLRVYRVFPVTFKVRLPKTSAGYAISPSTGASYVRTSETQDEVWFHVKSGSSIQIQINGVSALTADDGGYSRYWNVDRRQWYLNQNIIDSMEICEWLGAYRNGEVTVHGLNNNYYTGACISTTEANPYAEPRSACVNFRIYEEDPVPGWDNQPIKAEIYGRAYVIQSATCLNINTNQSIYVDSGGVQNAKHSYTINLKPESLSQYISVANNPSWVTLTNTTSASVTYSIAARTPSDDDSTYPWLSRQGSFQVECTIPGGYSGSKAVAIYQSAATAHLSIDKTSISLPHRNQSSSTITVTSNLGTRWSASTAANWITLKWTNSTKLSWTAATNDTMGPRSSSIEIYPVPRVGDWDFERTTLISQKYGSFMRILSGESYNTGWTISDGVGYIGAEGSGLKFSGTVESMYDGVAVQPLFVPGNGVIYISSGKSSASASDFKYWFALSASQNTTTTARTLQNAINFIQYGNGYDGSATMDIVQDALTPEVTIAYNNKYVTVSNAASTSNQQTPVTSNVNWVASADTSWITNTGKNGTNLTWRVTANTSPYQRTGKAYAKYTTGGELYQDFVEITQQGAPVTWIVTPSSNIEIGREWTSGTISVSTNLNYEDWEVTKSANSSWLIVDKNSNGVAWTAQTNNSNNLSARTAMIYIAGSTKETGAQSHETSINVLQHYGAYLATNPSNSMTIGDDVTSFIVSAYSLYDGVIEKPYVYIPSQSNGIGLTFYSSASTNGIYKFVFHCNSNEDINTRTATTVFSQNEEWVNLDITQEAAEPYISIAEWRKYATTARTVSSFTVSSNVNWSPDIVYVSGEEGWITATKTSNSKLSYTASTNNSIIPRSAKIYARYGSINDYGQIDQEAKEATLTLNSTTATMAYDETTGTMTASTNAPEYVSVYTSSSWITNVAVKSSGSTSVTIGWTANTNSTTSSRVGSINVYAGYQSNTAEGTIQVTQGCEAVCSITAQTTSPIGSAATYFSAAVLTYGTDGNYLPATAEFVAGYSAESVSSTRNGTTQKFVFTCGANNTENNKSYIYSISNGQAGTSINMYQNPKAPAPKFLKFTNTNPEYINSGASVSMYVTVSASSTAWTVSSSDSWLTASKYSATQVRLLTSSTANSIPSGRTSVITLTGTGELNGLSDTKTITQKYPMPYLTFSQTQYYPSSAGASYTTSFSTNLTANMLRNIANLSVSDDTWITASTGSSSISWSAAANTGNQRTGGIYYDGTLSYGGYEDFGDEIQLSQGAKYIPPETNILSVKYTTSTSYYNATACTTGTVNGNQGYIVPSNGQYVWIEMPTGLSSDDIMVFYGSTTSLSLYGSPVTTSSSSEAWCFKFSSNYTPGPYGIHFGESDEYVWLQKQ